MKLSLSLPQLLRDVLHWGDTFEDDGSVFEGAWVGGGLGFSPEGRWNKGVLWAWLMWGQSRDTHRAASAPHLSSASSVFPTMICLSPQLLLLPPPFQVMSVLLPPLPVPRHHPRGQILPRWLCSHAKSCPWVTIHLSCPVLPPPQARTWRPECQCRNR